ncbi:MAG TPA: autotransporter-associated beta strand repeat-containing protein [Kiritimatiellia bacterium]|nr:autotransporter-associated beta strand repeat-containing protein [Kiritimatiellia bacterium]HMO99734.1 autotransporter-associated beta strand repeat-containing protein [Kiritimatiellia bacterium]HMP97062.1 autotransporter-associated beta strand repeat-containing protein [Kiritimatiellia bacterium]
MDKVRLLLGAVAAFATTTELFAQQTVFSRGEVSTALWWDSSTHPWYYTPLNQSQNRPDNNHSSTTRHNVEIGHNNNLSMSVNGAFFGLRTLTFGAGNSSARTLTSSAGGGISLTVGMYNNSSGAHVLNVPIGVDAATVAIQANNGSLTFGSGHNIFLNANTAAFSGGNNIVVNSVMQGTGGGFTKAGAGRLDLNGNNTFTGSAAINAGIARVGHNNAFGTAAGGVTVASGAMVEMNNGINVGAEPLTLNGDGGGSGALRSRTGATASWAGAITLGSASRINASSGGTLTLSGGISGAHNLTFGGDGGNITVSGAIATGAGSVTKDGSGGGILTLSAANTYSGATTINNGTLRLGVANAIGDSSPVTVASGATFDLNNNADSIHSLAGAGAVTLGNATLTVLNGGTTYSGVMGGTGGLTKQGTGTLTLTGNNTFNGSLTISGGTVSLGDNGTSGTVAGNIVNNAALIVNRSSAVTLGGVISGSGTLTKQGNGALTLSNVNTYNGDTTISAGSIVVSGSANNSAFTVNSGTTLAGAGSVGAATINGTVSPGNATGDRATLNVTTLNLGAGGGYTFDISNVSGTPGTHWDLIAASGAVTVNGSGTFTIFVTGNPTGFSAINPYTWVIMSGASVAGFNPARFAINTSGFTPSLAGGAFSVAQSGNNIVLEFTPPAVPAISVQAGTLTFGNQTVNITSSEQSYTVSGINLSANIVITAPSGYQISTTSGSGFGSTVNLTPSGGTVNNTTIYVRFTPNNVAAFNGNITHTSTGAPQQDKAVTGTGTAPPNPGFFTATASSSSAITLAFNLNTHGKPVVIVRNTDNNFTTPSGAPPAVGQAFAGGTVVYSGTLSPQPNTGLNGGTLYYYRAFAYDNVNGHFYSSGLSASATTFPNPPVVQPDSVRTYNGFNANWNASSGATGYRIDVARDNGFTSLIANNVDVGNSTFYTVSGLPVGHYYYRVRAYNASGTSGNSDTQSGYTLTAQGANGGGSTPTATVVQPATLYVGDSGTFAVRTWGTIAGNWGNHRVVIHTDPDIMMGGIRGDWAGFDNVEYSAAASPQFTSAGTWYWGVQMDYGGSYSTNFWMVRNNPNWTDLHYAGTNANLSVNVIALENPTGLSAVKNPLQPITQVNLGWTKWNNRNVMVVRSTGAIGTPAAGTTYTVGQSIPGGGTVIYNGSGTSFTDTGLSANTTYNYRFFSENFGYYSGGQTLSETTDPLASPPAPVATAASSVGRTSFTANWNASAGATSYRLDVSLNAAFTDLVIDDQDVGNVTSFAVSGFGTAHYYYRVRAVNAGGTSPDSNVIQIGTQTAQARNTGGAASPQISPATIYVGDTATFGLDSDATLPANNWGRARVWVHTTANVTAGTPSSWSGFINTINRTVTRQMTSAGAFFYAIQLDYGFPAYSNRFWYTRSSASYYDMHYNPTGVTLQVTVNALQNPSGLGSTVVGQNQINLSWTKWESRDVMIVRSTGAIGTPTGGTSYNAGDAIPGGGVVVYRGPATSFNDTGLSQSTTYNYRFFSENFSYYSAGQTISATTEGDVPVAPTATAASSVQPTSFQANWQSVVGATSYRLDVSTVNTFSSFVGSYNNLNVGNVTTFSVSGLTGGQTYYYRVRAVNGAGAGANSGTITVVTPASATVNIVDIPPVPPTEGVLTWSATVGAFYDVYFSDNDGSSWTPVQQNIQAGSATETLTVTEGAKRHFRVVIAGQAPGSSPSPVWGVVKRTIPSGYSMMAAPLDFGNLTLNGEFGDYLRQGLAGDNGGNADKIMIRESNGSWTERFVNGSGNWNADYTFQRGQGFFMFRSGAPVEQRFDGPVGNNNAYTRSITTGWNIIGPSQGRNRSFSQLTSALVGTPTGSWDENAADLIVIDDGGGNWRRIMRTGSGTWLDLKTFAAPNITIQPGQGIYYLRQSSSGVTGLNL